MPDSSHRGILVYDNECTYLDASKGDLLAFGYKWVGQKTVHVPSVLDYFDPCNEGRIHFSEYDLVKEAHRVMSQAEMVVTFNGKNFDQPYLFTKFLIHRLPPIPALAHVDLYQVAKSNMRMSPKSLRNIAKVLKLKNQKHDVDFAVWDRATKGEVGPLREVRAHCAQDILVTEELYLDHLRPYVRQHPRINGYGPCRRCGQDTLAKRGRAVTIYRGQQQRYQCTNCAGWETRAN